MKAKHMSMEFHDIREITAWVSSDSQKEFVRTEYGYGLAYYVARLHHLMMSGESVLDAGCGVGQWSIALSQFYENVYAVDVSKERTDVLRNVAKKMSISNITVTETSIENLPYADACFDAIFCYGVIMLTDADRTLAEFSRVLRPGGRVYICLNSDGWSHYLIKERGKTESRVIIMGQQTLYNTYWERAIERGIVKNIQQETVRKSSLERLCLDIEHRYTKGIVGKLWAKLRAAKVKICAGLSEQFFLTDEEKRNLFVILIRNLPEGQELWDNVNHFCGIDFVKKLLDDISSIAHGAPLPPGCSSIRAYLPAEFERMTQKAGFVDFQWSTEGGIIHDWLTPPPEPRYAGYFENMLSVWECLFTKPQAICASSVEGHVAAALLARETRVYQEPTLFPVVSNCTRWTYPRSLLENAQRGAQQLGGEKYLKKLAAILTSSAVGEQDVAVRIIRFMQKAIFRDPVSQPLAEDGGLPDPLTILLCARGRCSHVASLIVKLFLLAGLETRLLQFPNHVAAEVKLDGRWVVVDVDAFKNGIIPVNREGQLISMDDIRSNPYQIDKFQPTGWFMFKNSRFAMGIHGCMVRGYVDCSDPEERGYVSGYYIPSAKGFPPSLSILNLTVERRRFFLTWTPSVVKEDVLLGYRINVGTSSRGWSYDYPGEQNEITRSTPSDISTIQTRENRYEGEIPAGINKIFASVTAFSSRIEKEPETYFWPSEEISHEIDI